MNKYISSILFLYLLFCTSLSAQVRILTIGDSTMANYDEQKNSGEKEMRGWAQMLPLFLTEGAVVENAAKNGRSSKSFYYEYWSALRETLKPGDYVFIQFGHNDEKADGLDSDESDPTQRGTAAWGQYQKYLGLYVSEARERGATPILLTPVVRRLFDKNNKEIIGKGLHNLTEIAPDDSTMNYPLAMRSLASNLNVPLVDLTTLTEDLVETMGAEKSKQVIYANGDNTHLKAMGGIIFSELVVEDLLRKNILTDYIIADVVLSVKPNNQDFGLQFVGKESIKVFTLFGGDIQPESGLIELSVNEPFSISLSLDKGYTQKIGVDYTDGSVYSTIYVRFAPKQVNDYVSYLQLKANNINQKISLRGEAVSSVGTEKFTFSWNPSSGVSGLEDNIKVSVRAEGLNLLDKGGKQIYEPNGGVWPSGDIDVNASRYIEIALTSMESDAYLDSLVFDLSSIGGKGMSFTALGSLDQSFSDSYTFALMESLQENKVRSYTSNKIILIPQGETFYIRIYPWYRSEATGKYLNVENILFNGLIMSKNR